MLSKAKLDDAVEEAEKFITRAKLLQQATSGRYFSDNPELSGLMWQSSMDLTRALSSLRSQN